ncbi:MAG: Sir2 family NAD-dependent protein deacetylase [Bacteroidales bacterium]
MKKLAVLSGAGVSKESGIQTFRDQDGLWENYPVEDVASIDGWYRDKKLVLKFYNDRRKEVKNTHFNKAHKLIAELEKHFDVNIITQNIDNLHEQAGSTKVLHLHGELTKARSEADESLIRDIGYNDIHLGDLAEDGHQLRPHIVWFGEAVPNITKAAEIINHADILLVIGTSLVVYPAAGLVQYLPKGKPLYLIDPQKMNINYSNYEQIQEVATKGMEIFTKQIL